MRPSPTVIAQADRQPVEATEVPRPLLYVASPITCYSTPRYDQMLEHVRRHFPDADLLPARGLYQGSAHWLATWPTHLARITGLVFFADTDRSIGRGVVLEIDDATDRVPPVPVSYLQDDGTLVPFERVWLPLINGGASWRRYAQVEALEGPDTPPVAARVTPSTAKIKAKATSAKTKAAPRPAPPKRTKKATKHE